ncbi:hypothetical protein K458DRAFT_426124 [Lentithecium fluviatile CBS 122367]|uniref:Uncharacterized protein n=1 Tax=Lentithecium fluviatile CBS 122367 TaxID=1168545 RepID=A0A6G1JJB3_9PLEO|nr:hypothetical protein K458DRAFT_426124 [Lentithecium fluviatile CBS 122367]
MPLFGSHKETTVSPPPTTTSPPSRSRTLFSRRRSSSPSLQTTSPTTTSPKRHSLLHKSGTEDNSILAAREGLMRAEAAEREADRALFAAKNAVKEAREHVRRLELEAKEEARLAKIKQSQARDLGKRGKMLGRHDHV